MTLTEALAASPSGIAVRKHNTEFMVAVTKDRRAFFYTKTVVAPASWPRESDDWMTLSIGQSSKRIIAEANR